MRAYTRGMNLPMRLLAPDPLDYFGTLVAEDEQLPLLEAAASLGQDVLPELDVQAVLDQVDTLGQRLLARLPKDAGPLHRLRSLNRYFFEELGFAGNVNDYHSPDNSYVHRVLETRRGIPITLAVLYIELATQIGLTARGISFPGHFLVKLKLPAGEAVLDPFTGHSLSRDSLEERLEPYRRQQGLVGEFEVPLGLFLQPATGREILARMLGNLKRLHWEQQAWAALLPVQQRLVRLLPQAWDERRDRGLVLAELGQADAASEDLCSYLAHASAAADAEAIQRKVLGLQARPGGWTQ